MKFEVRGSNEEVRKPRRRVRFLRSSFELRTSNFLLPLLTTLFVIATWALAVHLTATKSPRYLELRDEIFAEIGLAHKI